LIKTFRKLGRPATFH